MKNIVKTMLKITIFRKCLRVLQKFKSMINRLVYFGSRYECPLCDSRLRKFLPYGLNWPVLCEKHVVGAGYRINGICPVCNTIDRERLLWLFLKNKTTILQSPTKLLHIAPERSLIKIFNKQPHVDYLTADLNGEGVMVQMDITEIQYPDNSFDAIICCHVIQNIIDDRKAMYELYRVLKPGGWAILQAPISLSLERTWEDRSLTSPKERERVFGHNEYVRIYAKDYGERLEQAGFEVNIFEWIAGGEAFGGRENRFGLNRDEQIFYAIKPKNAFYERKLN